MIVHAIISPEPYSAQTTEIDAREQPAVEIVDRDSGAQVLGMFADNAAIEHRRMVERQFALGYDRAPALGPGIGLVDAHQPPSRRVQVGERVMGGSQIGDRSETRRLQW